MNKISPEDEAECLHITLTPVLQQTSNIYQHFFYFSEWKHTVIIAYSVLPNSHRCDQN